MQTSWPAKSASFSQTRSVQPHRCCDAHWMWPRSPSPAVARPQVFRIMVSSFFFQSFISRWLRKHFSKNVRMDGTTNLKKYLYSSLPTFCSNEHVCVCVWVFQLRRCAVRCGLDWTHWWTPCSSIPCRFGFLVIGCFGFCDEWCVLVDESTDDLPSFSFCVLVFGFCACILLGRIFLIFLWLPLLIFLFIFFVITIFADLAAAACVVKEARPAESIHSARHHRHAKGTLCSVLWSTMLMFVSEKPWFEICVASREFVRTSRPYKPHISIFWSILSLSFTP